MRSVSCLSDESKHSTTLIFVSIEVSYCHRITCEEKRIRLISTRSTFDVTSITPIVVFVRGVIWGISKPARFPPWIMRWRKWMSCIDPVLFQNRKWMYTTYNSPSREMNEVEFVITAKIERSRSSDDDTFWPLAQGHLKAELSIAFLIVIAGI